MRCSPAVWVLSPPKPLPLCRGCAAFNWDSILLPWAWAKMLLGVGLSWGWVVFWGHPEPLRGLCSLHTLPGHMGLWNTFSKRMSAE